MYLTGTDDGLMVQVRWRGLPESEDTLKRAAKGFEEAQQLFKKLLQRQDSTVYFSLSKKLLSR